jgi:hypothetical protein
MCATDTAYVNTNEADLCIVDANGRNFRQVNLFSFRLHIFPPAWLNNSNLVLSINNGGGAALVRYSLAAATFFLLDNDIPPSGADEDAPLIQDGVLFYRSSNPAPELRIATLDSANLSNPIVPFVLRNGHPLITLGDPFHTQVGLEASPGTFAIIFADYYEVSEAGYNLMYYTSSGDGFQNLYSIPGTDNVLAYAYFGTGPTTPLFHVVDNQFENFGNSFFGFALRNTVDWLP